MYRAMKYQNVRRVAIVVNTIKDCIPFVDGMAANLKSRVGTIFYAVAGDGFAMTNIARSILGIDKDLIEPALDQFLNGAQALISKESWEKIPGNNRSNQRTWAFYR